MLQKSLKQCLFVEKSEEQGDMRNTYTVYITLMALPAPKKFCIQKIKV